MMIIKHKMIRNAERRLRLCLIIPLGNGAKIQYPIHSESEAWNLYETHLQLNSDQKKTLELIHN